MGGAEVGGFKCECVCMGGVWVFKYIVLIKCLVL